MPLRRLLAIALFAGIAVASIRPVLLELPFIDRRPLGAALLRYADREWWPQYPAFLDDVRRATKPGDTIAVVVPTMNWDGGYAYAYYRASYYLAGREVLPLITPENERIGANTARARYVAVWRSSVSGRWRTVLEGHDGRLLVR